MLELTPSYLRSVAPRPLYSPAMPLLRSSSLVICMAVVRLSTADSTAEEEESWACAAISFFWAAGEEQRALGYKMPKAGSCGPLPCDEEEEADLLHAD